MRGRRSVLSFDGVSLAAVQDLFEVRPAANRMCVLERCVLTPDSSEVNQQLKVKVRVLPATVTPGSGGSGGTVSVWDAHDSAPGYTAAVNNTTQASTSGTAKEIGPESFPSQGGFEFNQGEDGPPFYNGEALVISLTEAPGAVYSGFCWIREF